MSESLPPSGPTPALPSPEPTGGLLASLEPTGGLLPPPEERFAAKPEQLPEPTWWPFFLAMGLAFIGWGLISTWVITVGGVIVLFISLIAWINILRHE